MGKIKNFFYSYWKLLLILTISISLFLFVIYYYYFYNNDNSFENNNIDEINNISNSVNDSEDEKNIVDENTENVLTDESSADLNYIYIDIKGEVVNPGIYKMNDNNRVIDAINIAGGLTIYANTSVNNLSMKLKDEMVIVIYSNDQVKNFIKTKEEENVILDSCKNYNNITNDSCITSNNDSVINKEKININRASKEELLTIAGIGETKALAIINYREENGLFNLISDIKNVSGIGDSVYEKIKDFITI